MTIVVSCQNCGKRYKVGEALAGKRFKCKSCQKPLEVPKTELPPVDEGDDEFLRGLNELIESEHVSPPEVTIGASQRQAPSTRRVKRKKSTKGQKRIAKKSKKRVEVRMEDGQIASFDSLEAVRDRLLNGVITRHNEARWVEPKPDPPDDDSDEDETEEYEENLKKWQERSRWRAIGAGVAREENVIRLLYEPEEVYADRGMNAITWIVGIPLAFAGLMWIWSWRVDSWLLAWAKHWNPEGNWVDRAMLIFLVDTDGEGLKLTVYMVKSLAFVLLLVVAAFLAAIPGDLVGTRVGRWLAKRRIHTFPRPPDDRYVSR